MHRRVTGDLAIIPVTDNRQSVGLYRPNLHCACAETAISELPAMNMNWDKFELDLYLSVPIGPRLIKFYCCFSAVTLCHAVTLTFNPLTLKVRSVSDVMRSNFVLNFSEINNPRLSYSDLTIENLGLYRSTQSWIWLEVDFHNFWASSDPWRTAKFLPNPTSIAELMIELTVTPALLRALLSGLVLESWVDR